MSVFVSLRTLLFLRRPAVTTVYAIAVWIVASWSCTACLVVLVVRAFGCVDDILDDPTCAWTATSALPTFV